MKWISRGRTDLETTDLGAAAFENRRDIVDAQLAKGIDWVQEGIEPVRGALLGRYIDMALKLIRAGAPQHDELFQLVFDHAPQLLTELAPRPDLLARLEAQRLFLALCAACLEGDVEAATRALGHSTQARINEQVLLSHGLGEMAPLHYAARLANTELLRLLLAAGADPNALAANGKSPLRLVSEAMRIARPRRRQAIACLVSAGGTWVPAVRGWWTRRLVERGHGLLPGED